MNARRAAKRWLELDKARDEFHRLGMAGKADTRAFRRARERYGKLQERCLADIPEFAARSLARLHPEGLAQDEAETLVRATVEESLASRVFEGKGERSEELVQQVLSRARLENGRYLFA